MTADHRTQTAGGSEPPDATGATDAPEAPEAPEAPDAPDPIESERARWYELMGLVRVLSPEECLEPGYYRDPMWSIRDLMGHIGTWLAEAEVQLMRINAGTYEGHVVDIDGLNEQFLEAVRDHDWATVSDLAQAGRTRMLQEWSGLAAPNDEATWWLRKSGADHYDEHLERLRAWVDELVARR